MLGFFSMEPKPLQCSFSDKLGATHILCPPRPEPRLEPPKLELKLELKLEPELEGMADLAEEKLLPPMRPLLRAAKAGLAELSICTKISQFRSFRSVCLELYKSSGMSCQKSQQPTCVRSG